MELQPLVKTTQGVLNTRPLHIDDGMIITQGHFLAQRHLHELPEADFQEYKNMPEGYKV